MAQLLDEIEWGEPLLPPVPDPAWEAEAKRAAGSVSEVCRRLAPVPWLRQAALYMETFRVRHVSARLTQIGAMVTAQENSCRYCYGATRAYLRLIGYSESLITRIEREAQLAELDPKEQAVIEFSRRLARSKPRPAQAEREKLLAEGYSPEAVAEIALMIVMGCFYNRVATLLACPPVASFERFAGGVGGRLVSLAAPLLRRMDSRKRMAGPDEGRDFVPAAEAPFRPLMNALEGQVAAGPFQDALVGAFESEILPRRTKALMFAVVARALECRFCEDQMCGLLEVEGLSAEEVAACLSSFTSPKLEPYESQILDWVRETVHYQPQNLQEHTRELAGRLKAPMLLEAIGVASLANATVRLAMLL